MPDKTPRGNLVDDLCIHIFTVSAAMVGVCLTVIGLVHVVISFQKADSVVDDFLAVDALLFLTSCLSAYWSLRTRDVRRMHRVERFADVVFVVALVLMAFVCVFITYAISTL